MQKIIGAMVFCGCVFLSVSPTTTLAMELELEDAKAVEVDNENELGDIEGSLMAEEPAAIATVLTCPAIAPSQRPFPLSAMRAGGTVVLEPGNYYINHGIKIERPVIIQGAGKDQTKVTVCITNVEAAIQVLSSNVTISGINVEVLLKSKLGSERGMFGTGITVGEYHAKRDLIEVKNVTIEDVKISRGRFFSGTGGASYSANGLVLIGRVSNVTINDIVMTGKHSHAFLAHWGGSVKPDCPYDILDIYGKNGDKSVLRCPIQKTWHPNNFTVTNFDATTADLGNFVTLSSVYNATFENSRATAQKAIMILAGDETNRYSVPAQKDQVGKNIFVSNLEVALKSGSADQSQPIHILSRGKSKYPQAQRASFLTYRTLQIKDVTLTAAPGHERYVKNLKTGMMLSQIYGVNENSILLKNINLGPVGTAVTDPASRAAYLWYSKNVTIDGLMTSMMNGVSALNSTGIVLKNNHFTRAGLNVPAEPKSSTAIIAAERLDLNGSSYVLKKGFPTRIKVENNEYHNYGTSLRLLAYQPQVVPSGETSTLCRRVVRNENPSDADVLLPLRSNCGAVKARFAGESGAGWSSIVGDETSIVRVKH